MADKLDLVFKKIVARQYTTNAKAWYEEQPGIPFKVSGTDVWMDNLPTTPPSSGTSSVQVFNTLTLIQDMTVGSQRSWLAEYPTGTRIGSFIPPRYGQGYTVRLYDANNTEILTTDGSGWFFDYELGVLTFDYDPSTYGWNDSAFKIKAYRYIGRTAEDIVPASGTMRASDIVNDSTVIGITVKDALEWLDSNKVDYNFGSNTISGTGNIYAGSYYGDGSNLTGIVTDSSSVTNESVIPGGSVTEALNYFATGSGVATNFEFNQPLVTVSGTQIYSIPHNPVSGTVCIFLNGLIQEPDEDYVITGNIITFIIGVELGDVLLANYISQ
jgi:hypothetical protein